MTKLDPLSDLQNTDSGEAADQAAGLGSHKQLSIFPCDPCLGLTPRVWALLLHRVVSTSIALPGGSQPLVAVNSLIPQSLK